MSCELKPDDNICSQLDLFAVHVQMLPFCKNNKTIDLEVLYMIYCLIFGMLFIFFSVFLVCLFLLLYYNMLLLQF